MSVGEDQPLPSLLIKKDPNPLHITTIGHWDEGGGGCDR